jgi:hypothetical protein
MPDTPQQRAEGVRLAHPLFQAEGGGETPTSALQLWFDPIDVDTAIALNRHWHSRLPRLVRSNLTRRSNKVFWVAVFDGVYFAVAVWTNPVARLLPQDTWIELRRFAIAPDAPKNTASRMLSWMTRQLPREIPALVRAVSYQDTEVHTGAIYRAAGWEKTALSDASYGDHHQWSNKSRQRATGQSNAAKQRWEINLLRRTPKP